MDSREALARLSGGRFMDDVHAAIVRVSEEVLRTGKDGTVTVKFKVKKASQGADSLVTVQDEIGMSLPKPEGTGAFYFVHDGGLHTRDPRQPELPALRAVEDTITSPRQVAPAEAVRDGG